MIVQLVVGCVLFALGSGNFLEYVPGEYPNEPSLEVLESMPPLSEMYIPIWAEAVKELAADDNRIKFVFRFFNRPNHYRYILDIILLLGNLDIPDEGYLPYFKREDGMAALKPLIDERKGFTESPAGLHTEDISEASHFPNRDIESIAEYLISQSRDADESSSPTTEHGIDSSTEYVIHQSIDDGEEVSRSTSLETESFESMVQNSQDDGQVAQSAESSTEASTEYVIYPSTVAEEEVPKSTAHEMELSEFLGHQLVEHSSEEDSAEFEHRSGSPYERHPPHEYREFHYYPEHHGSERSSDEDSEEFEHRIGLEPKQFQSPSEPETLDEDNSEESSEEECDEEHGEDEHIPNEHFPDYNEIPDTSFSCAGRFAGFYADVETGCQTFHICHPGGSMDTFICPAGTIFNQAILSCDYFYNAKCPGKSPFNVKTHIQEPKTSTKVKNKVDMEEVIIASHPQTVIIPSEHSTQSPTPLSAIDWSQLLEILPAKSKVVVYPQSATVKPKSVVQEKKSKPLPKRKVKDSKKAGALQIMKEMLMAAENMAKNAQPLLSQAASIGYLPVESVHGIKKHLKRIQDPPTTPRFVVKPASFKRPQEMVRKQSRIGETVLVEDLTTEEIVAEDFTTEEIEPDEAYEVEPESKPDVPEMVISASEYAETKHSKVKPKSKPVKEDVPEMVMSALEMAGAVLNEDILPFTRQALMENYIKHAKVKFESKPVEDDVRKVVMSTSEHAEIKHAKDKPKSKLAKDDVTDIVMSTLEMAGAVLNEDILPFTRRALMENYIKHAKAKQL